MTLQSAVYIAPPAPFKTPNGKEGFWSPIACTLIYSPTEAVLVDTPITVKQTQELISWIDRIAPRRKLSYIYITHGHGDHFFGLPALLERFPDANPVATPGTVAHMQSQIEEKAFRATWESRFPDGQIQRPFALAQPLPPSKQFRLQNDSASSGSGEWVFQAIETGHSDTHDSTILWVPDLRLAVCGDVVYGQVHQMLFEANTAAKREEWIRAIERVEALDPLYVVPGHVQEGEIPGVWHLANTKRYIRDFASVLETKLKSPKDVTNAMVKLYPDRYNVGAVIMSAMGAFQAAKEARQLLIIKPLSGKAPVDINILNVGEAIPSCCAVFPVYAVANVYFEVKDRIQDAKKEAAKFKAMLTEAQRDQQNIDGITAEIYKA